MPTCADTQDTVLQQQRAAFLSAERKLAKAPWKAFTSITKGLEPYPLYPYLEQSAILKNFHQVSDQTISGFLDRHPNLPIKFRLRRAWLKKLARQKKWQLFSAYYQPGDGLANACNYAHALYHTGQLRQAWHNIARLWLTDHSLPGSCDAPLSLWRKAGLLSSDLAWQRAILAVRAGHRQLAGYLRRYASKSDRHLLNLWQRAKANPAVAHTLLASPIGHRDRRETLAGEIVIRLAAKDLKAAMRLWRELDSRFSISAFQRNRTQQAIAIHLARKHRPEAPVWLNSELISDPSDSLSHWRLAVALWHQDWPRLLDLYTKLPTPLRHQDKWRYWRARALHEQHQETGKPILKVLSEERSYYGFRAADLSARPYHFGHQSLSVDESRVRQISRRPAAQRCRELLFFKRSVGARREWRQMLATLPADQWPHAAHLAHRWHWYNTVISTLANSSEKNDLNLRFPLAYQPQIKRAARKSGLSPARIFAVIRQESAFMATARSAAGAWGLMQLLPSTARYVARKNRLRYKGNRALLVPANNLRLGSLYLNQLQNRFGNNPVLASAAYNAGPNRVRRWLPDHTGMSGEVWIENIPFTETRKYIQRILTYQIIYAHRLEDDKTRMSDWMPNVPER